MSIEPRGASYLFGNIIDDRRVVFVNISKDGLQLLSKIDEQNNTSLLNNLTEEEARVLSDLLDKIR